MILNGNYFRENNKIHCSSDTSGATQWERSNKQTQKTNNKQLCSKNTNKHLCELNLSIFFFSFSVNWVRSEKTVQFYNDGIGYWETRRLQCIQVGLHITILI